MQKRQYTITINADIKTVWHTMLDDQTYREWTVIFNPGSYYEGSWEKGSRMLFLGPEDGGGNGGMLSYIEENKQYEFISIKHVGMIRNGVEDTTSEEVKKWTPAFENYTFKSTEDGTEVIVDIDINDEYLDMFNDLWPKALQKLKEIAER